MKHTIPILTALLLVASALRAATPALVALPQFTAAEVPSIGAGELEVPMRQWKTIPTPENLPGKGLAEHPMLYVGEGYNKMFLVHDSKVIWTYSTGKGGEFDDVWLLSNGNILFSRMGYAEEITPAKKVVWHLDPPERYEIHSVQPIGLDKVLVMQNGQPPKLMIINIKTGANEVDHKLVAPSPNGPGGTHGQFRRGRFTASGTYLISWLSLGAVVEYDKDFKEIWSYKTAKPWAAVRLHNGNTLITDEQLNATREVDPKGKTVWEFKHSELASGQFHVRKFGAVPVKVWEFKHSELASGLPFTKSQSCTRLANGNTVICSTGNGGAGCQLVEVTPDRKVVWALYDWKNLGPCTAVQMLDDPGIPENPGDLQR